MARGFLSGAIWGTVVSVAGLGALSVLDADRVTIASDPASDPVPASETVAETTAESPDTPAENQEPSADTPQDDASISPAVTVIETPEPSVQPEPEEAAEQADVADSAEEADDTDTPPLAEMADSPEAPEAVTDTPDDSMAASQDTATTTEAETPPQTDPVPSNDAPGRRPSDVTVVTPDATAPSLDAPDADADGATLETAVAPTPAPQTGDEIAPLAAPEISAAPQISPGSVSTGSPGSQAVAPNLSAPERDRDLNISTEPAQPPTPAVPDVETALVVEPDEVDPPDPADAPTDMRVASDESDATVESSSDPSATASNETAGEGAQRPQVRRLVPDTVAEDPPTGTADEDTGPLRPSIGTPAGSLLNRSTTGVTPDTARLPSIGAEPAPDAPLAEEKAAPPLQRFAAPADIDESLPRMSIVLIDDGRGPLGPDAIDNFPFPVTFALDPGAPGATERMAAYRALGYEVATLIDLPQGAQPTDVEQILAGAVFAVPEAVAMIEAPGGGLQDTRTSTEQLTSFAAESGHGLVFLPNGLNTAQAIARRENVAAVSVLRDFDGDGQDTRTKRRFLDGAAFRARQDGAVVMLGRLTPDTVSALLLWSLQDRAATVAMVPVSNLLLDGAD